MSCARKSSGVLNQSSDVCKESMKVIVNGIKAKYGAKWNCDICSLKALSADGKDNPEHK